MDELRCSFDEHGKGSPTPRVGAARPRSGRIRCGIPHLMKGESRQYLAAMICIHPPAARVCAGSRPSFPAMVPMWMFPMAIGLRQTFILKLRKRIVRPLRLADELEAAALPAC